MRPLRVAVVGCGFIAQSAHLPAYVENPKARLSAICDSNKGLLDRLAKKYNVESVYDDYHELMESGTAEAVSICTPTATHAEIAIEAARHGIHTLCEKPLASNLQEAREMVREVTQSKTKFMVGFNVRFLPNHVMAKKFMTDGRIGKPLFIRGTIVAPGAYGSEMAQRDYSLEAEKRIGVFFDLGTHLVDLFMWMMGKPRAVYGMMNTYRNGVKVDDVAAALIRFESGVLGNITTIWANFPDYQSTMDTRMVEIIGADGKIDSDFLGPSLSFYGTKSMTSKIRGKVRIVPVRFNPNVPDEALKWSYRKEIDCFLDSIIEDKEPPVTIEHGMNVLEIVISAYERTGSKPEISPG